MLNAPIVITVNPTSHRNMTIIVEVVRTFEPVISMMNTNTAEYGTNDVIPSRNRKNMYIHQF